MILHSFKDNACPIFALPQALSIVNAGGNSLHGANGAPDKILFGIIAARMKQARDKQVVLADALDRHDEQVAETQGEARRGAWSGIRRVSAAVARRIVAVVGALAFPGGPKVGVAFLGAAKDGSSGMVAGAELGIELGHVGAVCFEDLADPCTARCTCANFVNEANV